MKNKKRGQIMWGQLIPWLIAAAVLLLMLFLYSIVTGKDSSAITFIKNLFRFGP